MLFSSHFFEHPAEDLHALDNFIVRWGRKTMISGKVLSTEKTTVDFATVYLKGTNYGGTTNEEGIYHLQLPRENIH